MRRLASLFLLAALAIGSAPTADAQLRGLINRARQAVTGNAEATADAESATPPRDGPAPLVDAVSFLSTALRGNWSDPSYVLFAPENAADPAGAVVLHDATGTVVGSIPMKVDFLRRGTVVSGVRRTYRGTGVDFPRPLPDGEYTLDLKFGGRSAGTATYSVATRQEGNAFDSRTVTDTEGPWSTHAYFFDKGDAGDELGFGFWLHGRERAPWDVSVQKDGVEVAYWVNRAQMTARGHMVVDLYHAAGRPDANGRTDVQSVDYTQADLTPGSYQVIVKDEDGEELRRFDFEAGAGTITPHPRSAPGYEPHARALAPRSTPHNRQHDGLIHVYWLAPQ